MKLSENRLAEIFEELQKSGRCRTRKEFAEQMGVSYHGLVSAMNGDTRAYTQSLVSKAERLLNDGTQEPAQPSGPADVVVPGATVQMFRDMAATSRSQQETIAAQAQVIDRLVAHLTGAGYAFQGMGGGVAQSSKTEKR